MTAGRRMMPECIVPGAYRVTGPAGDDGLFPVETYPLTRTFRFEAGALVRGSVVARLAQRALLDGVRFEYAEDRGWFESSYVCRVSGSSDRVVWYCAVVSDWLGRLARE